MKTVEEYMELPYRKVINRMPDDQGGGFLIEVPLLGKYATCAWGKTEVEALQNLDEVMRKIFASWVESGVEISVPDTGRQFSGKIALRVPPYLHRALFELAEAEETSMNQLLNNLISESMGMRSSDIVEHRHYHEVSSRYASDSFSVREQFEEKKGELAGEAC